MFTKRLSWGIGILCVTLLLCLLLMAVNHAQTAARKMQSSNNLKQIGLAFHNFESAMKRLPAGCDEEAKHGWPTNIFNYMEASSWYSSVDRQLGWEHPFNFYKFRIRIQSYQNPGLVSNYTSEGYALTHYLANASIFYRGSNTKFVDIGAGLSNVWFAGEIDSKYPPFGYPYNWRALTWPINSKDGGFGAWSDGAQFALGDGAIRFVSSSIDRSVVEQLANAMPMPDSERTRIPDRSFQCGGTEFARTSKGFQNEEFRGRRTKMDTYSDVYFDLGKRPEVLVWRGKPGLAKLGIAIESMLSEYSEARVLDYGAVLELAIAEKISRYKNLEALKVGSIAEPDPVIDKLKSMQRLKYLAGEFDNELLERLRKELPACEVSSTEYSLRGK
jgi:Protein of unknown function (DUF1559)